MDLFQGIRNSIDTRLNARVEYESRIASKDTILDIGGRNEQSKSNQRLRQLSTNSKAKIVSTDIIDDYHPDIVDDICSSNVGSETYDAIYCNAVLEHVKDYEAAISNIHRILKPGGELFIYVPFAWCFHDQMDFHRFTFSEVNRILKSFSKHKLFLPDGKGYGGVFWQTLTFYEISRFPRLWSLLSTCTNILFTIPIAIKFVVHQAKSNNEPKISFREYRFFYTHLFLNHGFCGWAVK